MRSPALSFARRTVSYNSRAYCSTFLSKINVDTFVTKEATSSFSNGRFT